MTAGRGRPTAFDSGTFGALKRGPGTWLPQGLVGRASTVCTLTLRPSVASLEVRAAGTPLEEG
eukprot:4329935-Pyramimonas_sp.AAC.1